MAQFGQVLYLSGPWDWQQSPGGRRRCEDIVDRVKQYNIEYVAFAPTLYW